MNLYNIPLEVIYKKDSWSRLCQRAGVIDDFDFVNEKQIYSAVSKKWLATNSLTYFEFILSLARKDFNIKITDFSESEICTYAILCSPCR